MKYARIINASEMGRGTEEDAALCGFLNARFTAFLYHLAVELNTNADDLLDTARWILTQAEINQE